MPGTPEFDIFIKEVRKEMTVKCGQKCTAIRRIIVPEKLIEDVQIAISKQLDKVIIGDPRLKEVRMGALVNKDQVQEVKQRVETFWDNVPVIGSIYKLYDKYDTTFLTMLGMQYFN